uniref:Uncharacterized protein n=1 Tax=Anguilla anguilla TaxID=7936 RepID=A0A0E9XCT2_ANGAN
MLKKMCNRLNSNP